MKDNIEQEIAETICEECNNYEYCIYEEKLNECKIITEVKTLIDAEGKKKERALWEKMRDNCDNMGNLETDEPYTCKELDNGHNECKCTYKTCPFGQRG